MADFRAEIEKTEFFSTLLELASNASTSGLWDRMNVMMLEVVDSLYDQQGGLFGRNKWPSFAPTTIGSPRIGTDGREYGTYTESTDPLDASGDYRRSFGIQNEQPVDLEWGSDHKWAHYMPYRTWKYADPHKKNKKLVYIQRYVMPDPNSGDFLDLVHGVHKDYIEDLIQIAVKKTRGQ